MDFITAVGGVAAFCTTVSYFPQLKKCWQTGHTGDLSLRMLSILATGIAMWTVYGVLKSDIVIIIANAVSLALLLGILYFKLREPKGRK
jgi:MtN3 and saliva related transmembrane protein